MKLPEFCNNSDDKSCDRVKIEEPSYATQLRNFMKRNMPEDFDAKMVQAKPYVFASLVAWPTLWMYKGLMWRTQRHKYTLIAYINRTFFQAKLLQLAIIATGLYKARGASDDKDSLSLYSVHQLGPGMTYLERAMDEIQFDD